MIIILLSVFSDSNMSQNAIVKFWVSWPGRGFTTWCIKKNYDRLGRVEHNKNRCCISDQSFALKYIYIFYTYIMQNEYHEFTQLVWLTCIMSALLLLEVFVSPCSLWSLILLIFHSQRCRFCGEHGASIGCVVKSCRIGFHFPCGLKNGILSQYFGTFWFVCCHRILVWAIYLISEQCKVRLY